jgi:hypothetical protein
MNNYAQAIEMRNATYEDAATHNNILVPGDPEWAISFEQAQRLITHYSAIVAMVKSTGRHVESMGRKSGICRNGRKKGEVGRKKVEVGRKPIQIHKEVIAKNDVLPILGYVVVQSGYMWSTNLEMWVRTEAEGVNGRMADGLYKIVGPNFELETMKWNDKEDGWKDNYPTIPEKMDEGMGNMECVSGAECMGRLVLGSLSDLHRAWMCSRTEDSRWDAMSNVCFRVKDGRVQIAGTDGHRLSVNTINLEAGNIIREGDYLVPRKMVEMVLKDKIQLVEVEFWGKWIEEGKNSERRFEANQAVMDNGHIRVIGKLNEGTFPEYESEVRKHGQYKYAYVFNKEELASALKDIRPYACQARGNNGQTYSSVRLGVGHGDLKGLFEIFAQDTSRNLKKSIGIGYEKWDSMKVVRLVDVERDVTIVAPMRTDEGELETVDQIQFNIRYLIDAVSGVRSMGGVGGERVLVGVVDATMPVCVKGIGEGVREHGRCGRVGNG